jgi:hypothetical protein
MAAKPLIAAIELVDDLFGDMDERAGYSIDGLDMETFAEWRQEWIDMVDKALRKAKRDAG